MKIKFSLLSLVLLICSCGGNFFVPEGPPPVYHYTATLMWEDSNNVNFNIYRSTIKGGPYTQINTVLIPSRYYADLTIQSGQLITYYYVVTAVDNSGVESVFSNEVKAVVP